MVKRNQKRQATCTCSKSDIEKISALLNQQIKKVFLKLDIYIERFRNDGYKYREISRNTLIQSRDTFKKPIDIKCQCKGFCKICKEIFFLVRKKLLSEDDIKISLGISFQKLQRMFAEKNIVYSL